MLKALLLMAVLILAGCLGGDRAPTSSDIRVPEPAVSQAPTQDWATVTHARCTMEELPSDSSTDWPVSGGGPERTGVRGHVVPGEGDVLWRSGHPDHDNDHLLTLNGGPFRNLTWVVYSYHHDETMFSGIGTPVPEPPVIKDGVLYVSYFPDEGVFYALPLADETQKWRAVMPVSRGRSLMGIAAAEGLVVAGGWNVTAFDAETGAVVWQAPYGGRDPVIVGGTLYTVSEPSLVRASNWSTGETRWTFSPISKTASLVAPAISGGRIVVGSSDGIVYALDAAGGGLLWARQMGAPASSPAIRGDCVFFGAGRTFHALDLATGAPRWNFTTAPESAVRTFWSRPVVSSDALFVGSPRLHALDPRTGELHWSQDAAVLGMAAVDGVLYGGAPQTAWKVGTVRDALACSDGVDNDGDGNVDGDDGYCENAQDNSEGI